MLNGARDESSVGLGQVLCEQSVENGGVHSDNSFREDMINRFSWVVESEAFSITVQPFFRPDPREVL